VSRPRGIRETQPRRKGGGRKSAFELKFREEDPLNLKPVEDAKALSERLVRNLQTTTLYDTVIPGSMTLDDEQAAVNYAYATCNISVLVSQRCSDSTVDKLARQRMAAEQFAERHLWVKTVPFADWLLQQEPGPYRPKTWHFDKIHPYPDDSILNSYWRKKT
jgi:hypothetical protein